MPASSAAEVAHSADFLPWSPVLTLTPLALAAQWPPSAAGSLQLRGRAFGESSPVALLPPDAPARLQSARPLSCSSRECCTQSVERWHLMLLVAGILPALCRPLGLQCEAPLSLGVG